MPRNEHLFPGGIHFWSAGLVNESFLLQWSSFLSREPRTLWRRMWSTNRSSGEKILFWSREPFKLSHWMWSINHSCRNNPCPPLERAVHTWTWWAIPDHSTSCESQMESHAGVLAGSYPAPASGRTLYEASSDLLKITKFNAHGSLGTRCILVVSKSSARVPAWLSELSHIPPKLGIAANWRSKSTFAEHCHVKKPVGRIQIFNLKNYSVHHQKIRPFAYAQIQLLSLILQCLSFARCLSDNKKYMPQPNQAGHFLETYFCCTPEWCKSICILSVSSDPSSHYFPASWSGFGGPQEFFIRTVVIKWQVYLLVLLSCLLAETFETFSRNFFKSINKGDAFFLSVHHILWPPQQSLNSHKWCHQDEDWLGQSASCSSYNTSYWCAHCSLLHNSILTLSNTHMLY